MDWNFREARMCADRAESKNLKDEQRQNAQVNHMLWRARGATLHAVLTQIDKHFGGKP